MVAVAMVAQIILWLCFQIVSHSNELVDIQREQEKVLEVAAKLVYKGTLKVHTCTFPWQKLANPEAARGKNTQRTTRVIGYPNNTQALSHVRSNKTCPPFNGHPSHRTLIQIIEQVWDFMGKGIVSFMPVTRNDFCTIPGWTARWHICTIFTTPFPEK